MLLFPAGVLLISIALVLSSHRSGWLSVGGGIISAIGAYYWAIRLFRYPAQSSEPEVPPLAVPDPAGGGPGMLLVADGFEELRKRASDTFRAYLGVLLSIIGGIVGSAGPFIVDLLWPPSP
jgi:ABC-type branched-subunit amino acid transport system permease subunit